MAENNNNNQKSTNSYDLYAQLSKPFFSYKKPGDGNAYSMVIPQIHSGNFTLKFTKAVTSENRLDISCYLPYDKAQDVANILEGIMARRRDAFEKGEPYATNEAYKINITSFVTGKEEVIGSLVIDTEMIDGVPRIRITYFQNDKNDSVEIVFNNRVSEDTVTASTDLAKIDRADTGAYIFTLLLKEVEKPSTGVMYWMLNSLKSQLTKYFSAVLGGKRGNNNYNNNNQQQSYISQDTSSDDGYDPF